MQSQASKEEDSIPAVSLVDMFLKARELERKGKDVIHFDAGEPDFEPPHEVIEATIRALKGGKGRYTESGGIPEARKAVAESLNRKYHVGISSDQVLVSAGGRLALYYAFLSLPKDAKIGLLSPDWPAYRDISKFISKPMQFFKSSLEQEWNLNLDEIRRSDCNVLVLNYPNNPTGKILDLSDFEELIQIANDKKMIVISDEVYSDYLLNPSKHFKSILEMPETKSLLVTSLSKSYAMTGFRAAYIVSDPKTISYITKLNGMIVTSMPEFVQYALIAALNCDDYVRDKVNLIRKRRDVAARSLKKYLGADFYLSDGSMYMFPKLHSTQGSFNSEKFAVELLEKQNVSVTPGTSFGSSFIDHIRITLLQSESRIEEGIERMSKIVD
ncbi:MAG: pyridoxal phosphate-dependent aminotransferase [Thaumarchaeota archaeon]|nr:pyridoxal phosphate-dependent aminotransferase [Nitrososphaerota archaeon]